MPQSPGFFVPREDFGPQRISGFQRRIHPRQSPPKRIRLRVDRELSIWLRLRRAKISLHRTIAPALTGSFSLRPLHLLLVATSLAVGMFRVGPIASAQGVVQTGNALDANNQVGSGGSNTPVPGYVPANPGVYGTFNAAGAMNPGQHVSYQVVPVTLPGGGTSYARIPVLRPFQFGLPATPAAVELGRVSAISAGAPSSSVINNTGYSQSAINSPLLLPPNAAAWGQSIFIPPNGWAGPIHTHPAILGAAPYAAYSAWPAQAAAPGYAAQETSLPGAVVSPLFGWRQLQVQQPRWFVQGNRLFPVRQTGLPSSPAVEINRGEPRFKSDETVIHKVRARPLNQQVLAGVPAHRLGQPMVQRLGRPPRGNLYQQLLRELASGRRRHISGPGLPGRPALIETTLAPVNPEAAQVLRIDPITGLPIVPLAARTTAPSGGGLGGSATNGAGGMTPALRRQLQAGRRVPALNRLVGAGHNGFDKTMAQAQRLLRQGRFFDATAAYQNAIDAQPANPLPVIGQAIAQVAAGLYASARYNLQSVFLLHPELTAVRCHLANLLPAISVRAARRELSRLVRAHNDTGAFLLAWLDYQLDRQKQLRATLRVWAAWKTGGPWPERFQQAWVAPVAPSAGHDSPPASAPSGHVQDGVGQR